MDPMTDLTTEFVFFPWSWRFTLALINSNRIFMDDWCRCKWVTQMFLFAETMMERQNHKRIHGLEHCFFPSFAFFFGGDKQITTRKARTAGTFNEWRFGKWFFLSKCVIDSSSMWVFPNIGVPQNGWYIMENPIKLDDLGGATIFGNTHLSFWGFLGGF